MTMLDDRPAAAPTLEEALKALDSPASIADRRQRAAKRAKQLAGYERGRVIFAAGSVELDKALHPLKRGLDWHPSHAEVQAAEIEAGHRVDKLVFEQCLVHLRAEDMAEVYRDPDLLERERNWQAYLVQVTAAFQQQGDQSDRWVTKWRSLVAERVDAEQSGDPTGALDRSLERHVGCPFPVAPAASWESALMIPMPAEREAELQRLDRKYPGTRPGTPAHTDAPKRRGRK